MHDWWNASDRDARVRVEAIPGERFSVIETLFGLARLGHTNAKGMPCCSSRSSRRSSATSSCSDVRRLQSSV